MDYKRKIIEMLNKINDEKTLSFIYKIISNLLDQGFSPSPLYLNSSPVLSRSFPIMPIRFRLISIKLILNES